MNVARRVSDDPNKEHYFRRNLRLTNDPANPAIRNHSEELWILLYRWNPLDSLDPLIAFSDKEIAFVRLPFRFRVSAETGGRDRANILAIDKLRAIRNRRNDPDDQTFFEEFDMAVTAYKNWRLAQKEERGMF